MHKGADPNRSDISQFMYIGVNTGMTPPSGWWDDVTSTTVDTTSKALKAYTMYTLKMTSDNQENGVSASLEASFTPNPGYETFPGAASQVKTVGILKQSRTATWDTDWRSSTDKVGYVGSTLNASCSDDGFSWPHRTLGWKMLKDDLFGIDISSNANGQPKLVGVGETRTISNGSKAHDVDSVCLDCHNPTIWNATSSSNHTDTTSSSIDDYNDDLILRGLP